MVEGLARVANGARGQAPAIKDRQPVKSPAMRPAAEEGAERQPAAAGAWSATVIPNARAEGAPKRLAQLPAPVRLGGADVGDAAARSGALSGYQPAGKGSVTGPAHALDGIASYYWQGEVTATGERFDPTAMTAAHKTLPFGTRVKVTRVDTGSSVVVRINDRGPFKPGRVIDLSKRAAEEIDMTGRGLSPVKLEVLGP